MPKGATSCILYRNMSPHVLCLECWISQATYYNWKSKYGAAMEISELRRMKDLEAENGKSRGFHYIALVRKWLLHRIRK